MEVAGTPHGGQGLGLSLLSLPAAPRNPRAARAGGRRGMSVGSVSGTFWGPGQWVGVRRSGGSVGAGRAAARAPLVRSGVRRQLHVLGERGVREAWRVPLPPWLLRGQLRHQ